MQEKQLIIGKQKVSIFQKYFSKRLVPNGMNKEISKFTNVQPGYFFSTNVDEIRAEHGGEISVSDPHHISALRIKTNKGLCVIKSYPGDYEKINQWYENMNMKYTGAPLATSAASAFLRLLKPRRRILSA